jgi:hypothetical protein
MSLSNFSPTIWSAALQANLKKNLVARAIATTAYQGEILGQGSVVKIQKPLQLTAGAYSGTVTYAAPTSGQTDLLIDQQNFVAFAVPDVNAIQSSVDLVSAYTVEASYALQKLCDTYVMNLVASTALNSKEVVVDLSDADKTNWDSMFGATISAAEILDRSDAPREGRFLVASPRMLAGILADDTFVAATQLGDEMKMQGSVGMINGFSVVLSNNVRTIVESSDTFDTTFFGVVGSVAFAEQVMEMEALRAETAFTDLVRGLHIFGSRILEPDGLGRFKVKTINTP